MFAARIKAETALSRFYKILVRDLNILCCSRMVFVTELDLGMDSPENGEVLNCRTLDGS